MTRPLALKWSSVLQVIAVTRGGGFFHHGELFDTRGILVGFVARGCFIATEGEHQREEQFASQPRKNFHGTLRIRLSLLRLLQRYRLALRVLAVTYRLEESVPHHRSWKNRRLGDGGY